MEDEPIARAVVPVPQMIAEWREFKDARDGSLKPGAEWIGELLDDFMRLADAYQNPVVTETMRQAAEKRYAEFSWADLREGKNLWHEVLTAALKP